MITEAARSQRLTDNRTWMIVADPGHSTPKIAIHPTKPIRAKAKMIARPANSTMIEYRILKALVLGYIDPKHDEQRDVLIRPGDAPSGSMAALSSSDGATGGHSWISPKHAHR